MADPRAVEYVRANLGKYPVESLKAALVKGGLSPADAEEAARLAALPPEPPAAPPAPAFVPADPLPAPASATPAEAAPAPAADPTADGYFATARAVVLEPTAFCRAMPRTGGWKDPMLFLVVMTAASSALQLLTGSLLHGAMGHGAASALGMLGGGVVAVFSLVFVPLAVVVGAAMVHVLWKIMGSKQGFETSFRCVAYSGALFPVQAVAGAIPFAGPFLVLLVYLYSAWMFLPISVEAHEIPRGRVYAVLGTCAAAAVVLAAVVGVFAVKVLRSMRGAGLDRLLAAQAASGSPAAASPAALFRAAQPAAPPPAPAAPAPYASAPPLDTEVLKALIPARLPGFNRINLQSFRQGMAGGLMLVSARGDYAAADGGRVEIDLVDSAGIPNVLPPSARVDDYDQTRRAGAVQRVIAGRFLVKASGMGVDDAALAAAAEAIDGAALEKLAAGASPVGVGLTLPSAAPAAVVPRRDPRAVENDLENGGRTLGSP